MRAKQQPQRMRLKQAKILRSLLEGKQIEQIAREHGMTAHSVKDALRRAAIRFDLHDRRRHWRVTLAVELARAVEASPVVAEMLFPTEDKAARIA